MGLSATTSMSTFTCQHSLSQLPYPLLLVFHPKSLSHPHPSTLLPRLPQPTVISLSLSLSPLSSQSTPFSDWDGLLLPFSQFSLSCFSTCVPNPPCWRLELPGSHRPLSERWACPSPAGRISQAGVAALLLAPPDAVWSCGCLAQH